MLSPEVGLLYGLFNKNNYNTYRSFINPIDIFPVKEHASLLEFLDKQHGSREGDLPVTDTLILFKNSNQGNTNAEALIQDISKCELDSVTIETLFKSVKERNVANQVAIKALEVAEGKSNFDDLLSFVEENKVVEIVSVDDINILSLDICSYETDNTASNINWSLEFLRKAVGPIRKGNLCHIFAAPEVGKTAFWVSQVAHWLKTTDGKICIFFNEEDGKEVVYRIYSAVFDVEYAKIKQDRAMYRDTFLAEFGDRLIYVDEAALTFGKIERVMQRFNPAVCVIDNADKIKVKAQDRRDLELHNIYKWLRELAKQFCPILTVAHCDATGYGKEYLDMDCMANSKVGKPAEMDLIIGIGMRDGETKLQRYLNIPKNKLRGDDYTVEQLRHGRMAVGIEPTKSKFFDIIT